MPESRLTGLQRIAERLSLEPSRAPSRFDLYDLTDAVEALAKATDGDELRRTVDDLMDKLDEVVEATNELRDAVATLTAELRRGREQ